MNSSVSSLLISRITINSVLFSSISGFSLVNSQISKSFSPIILNCRPLVVSSSRFSEVLSNVISSDQLITLPSGIYYTPFGISNQKESILISKCVFYKILSSSANSVISLQHIATPSNATIEYATLYGCFLLFDQSTIIIVSSSNVFMKAVCVYNTSAQRTCGIYLGQGESNRGSVNYTSFSYLTPVKAASSFAFSGVYYNFSANNLNFSSCNPNSKLGDICLLHFQSLSCSFKNLVFFSNKCQRTLYLAVFESKFDGANGLVFVNETAVANTSELMYIYASNVTILNVYDVKNSKPFIETDIAMGQTDLNVLIIGLYTDRVIQSKKSVIETNIVPFSDEAVYISGETSVCISFMISASSTAESKLGEWVPWVASALALFIVMSVILVYLFINQHRKNQKISELRKVIDLDDQLSAIK